MLFNMYLIFNIMYYYRCIKSDEEVISLVILISDCIIGLKDDIDKVDDHML